MGARILVKDGKTIEAGGFTSAPVDAVKGNPAAEEHARTFVRRTRTAMALYFLSLASIAAAIPIHTEQSGHATRNEIAGGMLLGGLGFLIAGALVFATAPGHLYDAVNIYNDGIRGDQRR